MFFGVAFGPGALPKVVLIRYMSVSMNLGGDCSVCDVSGDCLPSVVWSVQA